MVAISLRDTGAGMDLEVQQRVFEPFFTTKAAGKGTGLGLSQVYGFASQSGGDVRLDSAPGNGTTFTILLPSVGPMSEIVQEAARADTTEGQLARILVVEDNEQVGAFAETLLTELGHKVVLASSGEQALEIISKHDFDLVFSDVVMPGMGGLALSQRLAELFPALPVILATGYSEEILRQGSGDRPVILKPYRLATLSDAIEKALVTDLDTGLS
jgi:CheY-like chemotaxis protein